MSNDVLTQYQYLIAQAEELERMAGPDPTGGQTYWRDRIDSTRKALADRQYQPDPQSIGNAWALMLESVEAVHAALDQEMIDALWLRAAKLLRLRAQRMRTVLAKEAEDIQKALDAIAKVESEHPEKPSAGGDS